MCSISWCFTERGEAHILFNRDESRQRPEALPLRQDNTEGISSIYPVDPQGGGTWLAVNDKGLCIALLNYYQGKHPKGRLISRGALVKQLSHCHSLDHAITTLKETDLLKFAPFSLLLFAHDDKATQVRLFQWDGKQLQDKRPVSPLISSAFALEEVTESRVAQYTQMMSSGVTLDRLTAFHCSHEPRKSYLSTCMHREDAHTVSFSRIHLQASSVSFFYQPASPCKYVPIESMALSRSQITR